MLSAVCLLGCFVAGKADSQAKGENAGEKSPDQPIGIPTFSANSAGETLVKLPFMVAPQILL
jgi:hypothetical protein